MAFGIVGDTLKGVLSGLSATDRAALAVTGQAAEAEAAQRPEEARAGVQRAAQSLARAQDLLRQAERLWLEAGELRLHAAVNYTTAADQHPSVAHSHWPAAAAEYGLDPSPPVAEAGCAERLVHLAALPHPDRAAKVLMDGLELERTEVRRLRYAGRVWLVRPEEGA
ncbi:hypothetical protein [Deinococcus multiflagellatus]|uniref:Uncharacterized protein n=1 Tax=Deinococcus multiflagellatus TaxID=1656887 RepID=A0ABW1ZSE1_9DEIO